MEYPCAHACIWSEKRRMTVNLYHFLGAPSIAHTSIAHPTFAHTKIAHRQLLTYFLVNCSHRQLPTRQLLTPSTAHPLQHPLTTTAHRQLLTWQLPTENCPPDVCPHDNCPHDNCPHDNCSHGKKIVGWKMKEKRGNLVEIWTNFKELWEVFIFVK